MISRPAIPSSVRTFPNPQLLCWRTPPPSRRRAEPHAWDESFRQRPIDPFLFIRAKICPVWGQAGSMSSDGFPHQDNLHAASVPPAVLPGDFDLRSIGWMPIPPIRLSRRETAGSPGTDPGESCDGARR